MLPSCKKIELTAAFEAFLIEISSKERLLRIGMLSTYEVLPTHAKVVEGIPIPIVVNAQPLSGNPTVLKFDSIRIPKCSRCHAYVSSVCACSDQAWCCSVCSQIMHLDHPVDKRLIENEVIEVIQSAEAQPLHHCLFVFTPIKSIVKEYLEKLPPRAPITIITYTDIVVEIPTGSVEQILSEFDTYEFPTTNTPFQTAVNTIIAFLPDLLLPCWCRVFIETPPGDTENSPILATLKKYYQTELRIDFYFNGTSYSPILPKIVNACPGLSRVFHPITEADMPQSLFSDLDREFALQLLVVFRAGVAYQVEYMPSAFLASEICDPFVRIPVLPSPTAALNFKIIPPERDDKLRLQAMQCVVKFSRWNPKTNRLSHLFRIISKSFKLSNNLQTVINSVSTSSLFFAWLKESQSLPLAQMSSCITDHLKALAPVLAANKQLMPIIRMGFLSKSHPALSAAFWDRLTMGSLISLSSPSAISTQFSFAVELWSDVNKHVETLFTVDEEKKKGKFIFVIKSFPSCFILTPTGELEIPPDSDMNKSIQKFIEECQPLQVKVIQSETSSVSDLLSLAEEEGLYTYLKETGLESFSSYFV